MGASALSVDDAAAASKRPAGSVALQGKLQKSAGSVRCGKIRGSWLPGTKLPGPYFISHTQQATNYKKLATRTKGKARTKNLKTAASFKSKASSQLKNCRVTTPTPKPTPTPTPTPTPKPTMTPIRPSTPTCIPGTASAPTPPSDQLRFSLAGTCALALKGTAAASARARTTGAHVATTGSNLQTITSSGAVADAVTSGTADISKFLIAPNDKVYVVFATPVDLTTGAPQYVPGTSCLLAEVAPETGLPTCIDNTLTNISWATNSRSSNPAIQFDNSGAIYYSGNTSGGRTVLRKYLAGQTSDLISDQVQLSDWLVLPDGGAIVAGTTTATNQPWTRRITPVGGIQSLLPISSNFLKRFPDGNVYVGVWGGNSQFGVKRFLTDSSQMDTRYWIAGNLNGVIGSDAYFNAAASCSGTDQLTRQAFCGFYGSYINGFFTTTDGKAFGLNGCCGQAGLLTQYYPTLTFPQTTVQNITVAQGVITYLILAGTDAASQNIMTLYDTSNGAEEQLLGAENDIEIYHVNFVYKDGVSKVLFDGLRFSDNKYVLGQVDLATKQVSVTSTTAVKWSDFQTFG
jgi:hypothetical protein